MPMVLAFRVQSLQPICQKEIAIAKREMDLTSRKSVKVVGRAAKTVFYIINAWSAMMNSNQKLKVVNANALQISNGKGPILDNMSAYTQNK